MLFVSAFITVFAVSQLLVAAGVPPIVFTALGLIGLSTYAYRVLRIKLNYRRAMRHSAEIDRRMKETGQ